VKARFRTITQAAKFPPITVFYDGTDYWLADGFHRVEVHKQLGLVEIEADIRQGTRRDAVLYSVGANSSHGLRRTNEDKRRAVGLLLGDDEWRGWSDNEIAKRCSVHHSTVGTLRRSLANSASDDRRTYTTKHGTVARMNTAAIGTAWSGSAVNDNHAHATGIVASPKHRISFTGNQEWHTPPQHIELARKVLGEIDLDPASNEAAQETVRATRFFSKGDDGRKQPWSGRVWLNPPYSQPEIADFVNKMVDEVASGNVSAAIVLTNNSTETKWCQTLLRESALVCFPAGRLQFEKAGGDTGANTQGQAFFYFGSDPDKFAEVFGTIGFVERRSRLAALPVAANDDFEPVPFLRHA
jgi:hypothetical protein